MKIYKFILIILVLSFLPVGCQTVQDGLGGKKRSGSDEFLVQKKNPLVLPPDYQNYQFQLVRMIRINLQVIIVI